MLNVSIEGFRLINTSIDSVDDLLLESVSAAHLYFSVLDTVQIYGFFSDNNLAMTIISAQQIKTFGIINSTFDWTYA